MKISLDAAIDIAVADAGVARADAKFAQAKLDSDDLVAHYDIEFIAGANEYDYEIAVTDGSILKKEVEPADPSKPSKEAPARCIRLYQHRRGEGSSPQESFS